MVVNSLKADETAQCRCSKRLPYLLGDSSIGAGHAAKPVVQAYRCNCTFTSRMACCSGFSTARNLTEDGFSRCLEPYAKLTTD